MSDAVQIRKWEHFWNDYIYEGKKNGLRNEEIRRNLIEAFRKEIFDIIKMRAKVEDINDFPYSEDNNSLVTNIFRNELFKWKRLVKECQKHLDTMMLIKDEDLTLFDTPEVEAEEEEEDDDAGYEFEEAKDPVEEERVKNIDDSEEL